jgi:2-C-methyl-D-erythritol 4-phosphate cytidylyltransferase
LSHKLRTMTMIRSLKKSDEAWGLVVAGGKGIRLGRPIPKQFLGIKAGCRIEETVLDLPLRAYDSSPDIGGMVLVYPAGHFATAAKIAKKYAKIRDLVEGGQTRQMSVMRGLMKIAAPFTVIHDAARPLVHPPALAECVRKLRGGSRAVHTVCQAYATMLLVENGRIVDTVSRDRIAHGQCPVGLRTEDLKQAFDYTLSQGREFCDELSLVRYAFPDIAVDTVEGHPSGFKITYPEDLALLGVYLQRISEVALTQNFR